MQTKYGGVWGVSEWCLRVSGSVWKVSEHVWLMSGFDRYQINWKQLNKYHGIQILLFLPVASCRPNMGMSEGCLDGVWGCLAVSGWCLSVSGRCLDLKSNEIFLITVIQSIYGLFFQCSISKKMSKNGTTKNAILQSEESSNKKMQENKLALRFNFT